MKHNKIWIKEFEFDRTNNWKISATAQFHNKYYGKDVFNKHIIEMFDIYYTERSRINLFNDYVFVIIFNNESIQKI